MSARGATARMMARAFFSAPTGPIAAVFLLVIAVLGMIGPPVFGDAATEVDLGQASQGPTSAHPLGTDALGRDILARTLAATRLSILLTLAAVGLAAALGSAVGAVIASAGPRARRFGAGVIDTTLSFGGVLLAVFIVAIVGIGSRGAVIAVALAFTPAFARFTYSLTVSVSARDYVVAARLIGVSRAGLLRRHVFPNIADSLAVATFTAIADGLIAVAALSFLGLGVQPPQYDWGSMLTQGIRAFYITPWAALAPAIMIASTGMAFALLGDAIARAVNPLLWVERPRLMGRHKAHRGRVSLATTDRNS